MDIDEKFLKEFVKVTQQASIATFPKIGKKDKNEVDKLATDAMRKVLNNIEMKGRVVIGEGEIDEAPMLYIGEILGNNDGPEIDIAVDPLEGTNFAANNLPGALSVIAVAEKNLGNTEKAIQIHEDNIKREKNSIYFICINRGSWK